MLVASCSSSSGGNSTPSGPTPSPVTPSPSPSATQSSANAGGTITIVVPTPAPIVCSPSPVAVSVGVTVQLNCSAQSYVGPFTWTVADPTVASVTLFNNENFGIWNVTGLKAGTTTISLQSQVGGVGSDSIVVSP
jgi:hypothetical protein